MTRLLLDTMLGRLTSYLRMCGHDVVYTLDDGLESDDSIRDRARTDDRILLTRDRELAGRTADAVLLESRDIDGQLQELLDAGIELSLSETPQRCSACNGGLTAVSPETKTPAYAPSPYTVDVWQCRECGQHFWKGSHWEDMSDRLAKLRGSDSNPQRE